MALDPRYVIAPSLQMYFVNKDTGLPLTNGQVFFFEDDARTIPKDVFEISGNPPNYSYNVLPNPVTLSAVGTFQDNSGADIIPYYFPYDSNGNIQLYYIEVYDSNGVLQFTREGWPNFSTEEVTTALDVTNFIPNGQFILHDNIPASSSNSFVAGQISQDTTIIAPGGWTFERGPTSTATDFITFPAFGIVESPTGNPVYGVKYQTTISGSDTRKDLCIKFNGVNTFASDTQSYNFYFEGESTSGSAITNVQIIIRKFFGTGGSPSATTETVIDSITLNAGTFTKYNIPILFGENAGKSLGTNGDDYVQICLRFPPTSVQSALLTDFALITNNQPLASFPTQTEGQQISQSTAGNLAAPSADGFNLYLPSVLGPNGLIYDSSSIGSIVGLLVKSTAISGNLILCDGSSFFTYDYSSLGIPYQRLQQVLFDSNLNGPIFGTGINFVNSYVSAGLTTQMMLITNKAGLQTNPSDGTTTTGFTFNPVTNAGASGIAYNAYTDSLSSVTAIGTVLGAVLATVSAGTSGMAVIEFKQFNINGFYYAFNVQALSAAALSAGLGLPGLYFDFSSTTISYRMWFKVAGEVAPAAGGRTLIQVNLASTMSNGDVSKIIAAAISRQQTNTITVTGLPAAGSFFNFNANSVNYKVWYQVNGSGTAPSGTRQQLIQVTLTGAETNAQVASKTITAINSQFFAVPDLRGMFLRGADPNGTVDANTSFRYGYFGNTATIGTYQLDELRNHYHLVGSTATGGGASIGSITPGQSTQPYGGFESRPVNTAIFWCIRY